MSLICWCYHHHRIFDCLIRQRWEEEEEKKNINLLLLFYIIFLCRSIRCGSSVWWWWNVREIFVHMVKFMMKRFVQLKVFNRMHLVKKKGKRKRTKKKRKWSNVCFGAKKKACQQLVWEKKIIRKYLIRQMNLKKKFDSKIRIQFDFVFLFRNRIRIDLFLNIKKIEQLKSPLDSICVVSSSENGPSKNRIEIHPNLIALLFLFFFFWFFFWRFIASVLLE